MRLRRNPYKRWIWKWLVVVVLAAPALAQQQTPPHNPTLQLVSDCIRGIYDECQLVNGHWYYRQGQTWARDDGVKEAPPKMPVVACPVVAAKTNDSPWSLNAKASVFAFAATATLDCLSNNGPHENNGLLRNSHGGINQRSCFAINGTALGLTILIQRKHPKIANWFRWIGAGGHGGAAAWNWRQK